jgi:hypothetical protein
MKIATSLIVTVAALSAAQSQNLLFNGDFDAGNVGFTSTYIYSSGDTVPERTYAVISDPAFTHGGAASFKDHTSGVGLMLVANGSSDSTNVVWSQTVGVATNRAYAFSGWGATWGHIGGQDFDPAPPAMRIFVNGAQTGEAVQLIAKNGQWQSFTALWDSQSATQAIIEIRLATTALVGNDIALDDFSFASLSTDHFASISIYRSVEIDWESVSNRFYQVQCASSLAPSTWFNLGPPVLATATNSSISDRVLSWDKKFYRVLTFE